MVSSRGLGSVGLIFFFTSGGSFFLRCPRASNSAENTQSFLTEAFDDELPLRIDGSFHLGVDIDAGRRLDRFRVRVVRGMNGQRQQERCIVVAGDLNIY